MSAGHRADVRQKSEAELLEVLGQGDTPKLMAQSFAVDHAHDIAYAGGASIDRRTVYVDRTLYRDIMAGRVKARGLSPHQLIERIIDHEHTEKAVDDGNNPVDVYEPAHAYALRREHDGVEDITGPGGTERYEKDLRPALAQCQTRFLQLGRRADPPKDLWCGPYIDHATAADRKILQIMRAKGVRDAHKVSKFEVHYGTGPEECRRCSMFGAGHPDNGAALRECSLVAGLVRDDRWCDQWKSR
jgi:hypothetical protein